MRKTAAPTSFHLLSKTLGVRGFAHFLLGVGSAFLLCSCVIAPPAPYEEYVLARAAVRSAQEVDSARFSAGLWNRADESYRNGAKAFKDADFKEAKQFFEKAIDFAERAENSTRLKKFQSGDSFP